MQRADVWPRRGVALLLALGLGCAVSTTDPSQPAEGRPPAPAEGRPLSPAPSEGRPLTPDPAPEPASPDAKAPIAEPPAQARADGERCTTAADCQSGVCEGEGCEPDAGTCMPKQRMCTRDLRPYCGCDGQTFRASGSCPGRTFSARAPCS
ncbi:MAG: hypothetical protein R3A51_01290 [Nannocystaceae bacterium]